MLQFDWLLRLCRLKSAGAKRVFAIITHGIFSGAAMEKIESSDLEAIVATNTIPLQEKMAKCSKLKVSVSKNFTVKENSCSYLIL